MNRNGGYEAPSLDITYFGTEDIMTVSGGGGGVVLPDHDWE